MDIQTLKKLPGLHLDSEGRCVCVELADNTVIFAVYCPANSQCTYEGELFRLTFIKLLLQRCYNLVKLYPKKIVIMGRYKYCYRYDRSCRNY